MFNYLKWELKDYFNRNLKWFIVALIIYALILIIPFEDKGLISGLVALGYMIVIMVALLGTYFAGTKHAVDTFSRKTFLLESMIPISSKKILLTKYLLGIIINFIYLFLVIIGFLVVIMKGIGVENTFEGLKKIIEFTDPIKFFEGVTLLICSSTAFLSVVVLCFVGAKAMNPNNKHDKILGFILAVITLYVVSYIISSILNGSTSVYLTDLVFLIIALISFFLTTNLVENKLEIYN